MMPKKILILALLFGVTTVAFSQTKKPPPKRAVRPAPKLSAPIRGDNSLLYRISGKGLSKPSWLFGTMHVLCADDAKLSEGLKKAIGDSKDVFFEVDISNMSEMMGALKFLCMNEGTKLTDLLTPVEYQRVKNYFDSNSTSMPLAMMTRFKPFFITAMIGENILDCKKKSSMEQVILEEAKKDDKTIHGLETIEFQASLFDSIPYDKQAKELLTYVDSIDNYRSIMQEAVRKYRKQDVAGLDSLMQKSDPGMNEYLDLVLYQRNSRWYDQIAEKIFQQPALFAVGAGHLGGNKGVISLLRKNGFTVTPVKN